MPNHHRKLLEEEMERNSLHGFYSDDEEAPHPLLHLLSGPKESEELKTLKSIDATLKSINLKLAEINYRDSLRPAEQAIVREIMRGARKECLRIVY